VLLSTLFLPKKSRFVHELRTVICRFDEPMITPWTIPTVSSVQWEGKTGRQEHPTVATRGAILKALLLPYR
jgi:hypothetical protein